MHVLREAPPGMGPGHWEASRHPLWALGPSIHAGVICRDTQELYQQHCISVTPLGCDTILDPRAAPEPSAWGSGIKPMAYGSFVSSKALKASLSLA